MRARTVLTVAVCAAFGGADQYLGTIHVTRLLGEWTIAVSGMSAPWLIIPAVAGVLRSGGRAASVTGLVATMSALAGYFAMTLSPAEGVAVSQVHWAPFLASQLHVILPGLVSGPLYGWLGYRWVSVRSRLAAAALAGAACGEPVARLVVGELSPHGLVWAAELVAGMALAGYFALAAARAGVPGVTPP